MINLQQKLKRLQELVCSNKYSGRQGSRELRDIFLHAIRSLFTVSYIKIRPTCPYDKIFYHMASRCMWCWETLLLWRHHMYDEIDSRSKLTIIRSRQWCSRPVLPLYFGDPHVVLSPVHQNDKLVLVPPLLERIPLPSDTTHGLVLKIITRNLYSIPL